MLQQSYTNQMIKTFYPHPLSACCRGCTSIVACRMQRRMRERRLPTRAQSVDYSRKPREYFYYYGVRWAADIRNPSSREHLWNAAARSAYTAAPSAGVHPIMSLRSSHLVRDHCIDFEVAAVAAACSLCHVHPSCPDFGSAPWAQAAREHRWRHIEHLLFECQCVPGLDSSVKTTLLRDDLFRMCSGSDNEEAVLRAAFPTSRTPVVAGTACVVPFLLDPAAALGRISPWHMNLQCLDLTVAFLLGVSSAMCTRQPLTASMLAHFRLPAWSSVHAWLLRLRTGSDFAPALTCA